MFQNFNQINQKITLDEAFNNYINKCTLNKQSPYTIKNKKVAFEDFKKELNEEIIYCNQLNNNVIENFKAYLIKKNNINSTVNSKITMILTIFNYFYECGWCDKLKTEYLPKQQKIYNTYTPMQLEKLLKKPDIKKCSFPHYRAWVMVNFLYSTGVRKRTLINIKIEDVNFNDGIIVLKIIKNKKQMYIPMSNKLKEILEEYLYYRGGQPQDYLFTDRYGNQLTTDNATAIIIKYNQSKGVYLYGTHRFRHCFATDYIKNGGNIVDLQHLLGHQSLEITQQYINLLITDLKEHNNTFNPLDNFLNNQKKQTTIKMKR